MVIKKEKKGNITVYHVDKIIPDDKMAAMKNKRVIKDMIKMIINDDADVYTTDGKLLMKFRKAVLPDKNIKEFYENVIDFAHNVSGNRGSTSGSKKKNIWDNPRIMSNILGYFDRWSPIQKFIFSKNKVKTPLEVRECRFNIEEPEKYAKLMPLVQNIDALYKKHTPEYYEKQRAKANQTHFKIPKTCFTTITTNVNFQTTIHKDKGDDEEGFGNLVVIESGKYDGGETCMPQYGIGVNVRTNDILLMDVHEWHANLPIHLKTPDAKRLSIVCYLRMRVWDRTKNKSKEYMARHNKTVKRLLGKKTIKPIKTRKNLGK